MWIGFPAMEPFSARSRLRGVAWAAGSGALLLLMAIAQMQQTLLMF